ncbi:BMP family ABC transporter substrate-binding protein [Paracoccus denitrificans]|jgi:simple sugar transport system substrate-binding protein|uniref:Nucleoside-binding protein n=1 Tax=Paracoccus denitrificans (strain Pd 1222) TaxID=318586 RepID=A1B2W9_PARDP|nr:BMP family ABC transporter substrate-binding protein [Paracoccus denitrificans]ABL69863.1 nucleoside-binding protein [Paracoccus denitrificans PD1222]MBB4626944.1 simple sugar transport system substrate-binding protein [Paracoccus denitrificans]MCU7428332.1 BMP family ABC transporter substrate-binding protein [Paracoccus denitrificans]QAR25259.1 BMP family ABC transporter substrate-binding protein [Paracoccus denitrificans]UPV94141.1 BMP family ABC transporter substrate-binding protein [Par
MKRRTLLGSAAALVASTALPAFAQEEKLKVGFIYVGPVGDGGWTYQHDLARQAVEREYGDRVETTYIESVPEGADAERAITQLALSGHKLIFTTSFGFMDATINVAKKFPDVKFEHATGYKTAENVATYDARFYEGRAVLGTIAGRMTKSNKIGYIGSFPIPEVVQGINSAYIHARKVNPDVEMKVVWAYTWFDPAKEADAAAALIAEGVDVFMQHTDSTAPLAKAQEAGAFGFGQASDMSNFAPQPRLASIIDNWEPYYIKRVGEALEGTWKSHGVWLGIGDGEVVIGEITDAVPAEVKAEAEALRDQIASGEYHPFTGPLNKQDGTPWLAEGQAASDEELSSMNFYVEGITAPMPK